MLKAVIRMAKGRYNEWIDKPGLEKIGAWARNGLSNEQIASNIGISRKTLHEWTKKYEKLREVLKKDKETADIAVENAVFKRACGYTEKVRKHINVGGKLEEIEEEVHIPGDVKAQIFWLQHRKPEAWNAAPENMQEDVGGVIEIPIAQSEKTNAEAALKNEK